MDIDFLLGETALEDAAKTGEVGGLKNLPADFDTCSRRNACHMFRFSRCTFGITTMTTRRGNTDSWTDTGPEIVREDLCRCRRPCQDHSALRADDHRSRGPGARPHLRLGHDGVCRRAVGAALDHHRYLAGRPRARPRPDHGRALSLLHPGRQPRRAAGRGEAVGPGTADRPDPRRPAPGFRVWAGPPHHPQGHRQQRRDRCHLGAAAAGGRGSARRAEPGARRARVPVPGGPRRPGRAGGGLHLSDWNGPTPERRPGAGRRPPRMGGPARAARRLAPRRPHCGLLVLESPDRAAAGDRCFAIARQADFEYLYDQPVEDETRGPGRRSLHRREPGPPPNPGGG